KDAARFAALKTAAETPGAPPQAVIDLARFLSAQGAHRHAADLLLSAATRGEPPAPTPAPAIGPTLPAPAGPAQLRFEAGLELLAAHLFPQAADLFAAVAGEGEAAQASVATGADGGPQPGDDLRAAALFNLGVSRASLRLDEQAARTFATYIDRYP